MPKFGRKVPGLRCESHTNFKVKRLKFRVRGGRGHTVSVETGSHTACFHSMQMLFSLADVDSASIVDIVTSVR